MNVNEVLPNLYLGPCPRSAEDVDQLRQDFGVTAVLNLQTDGDLSNYGIDWESLNGHYRRTGVEIRRSPILDFQQDDLRQHLPQCVEVLSELLAKGHRTYVHCSAGINRSPSAVIAYLHWKEGWELDRAARHVRSCRPCDPYLDAIRLASEDRQRA
jgi:protein-tyrosine phosphatase